MSSFKDLFSSQADDYARFRPTYPDELFAYLASVAPSRELALDCGTGNGQAALKLASFFERVVATDPSRKQLDSASPHLKIEYRQAPAEQSGLADHTADLVTAAQAFHWFKPDTFFPEARRVLKPGGVVAIWSYALAEISPEVDAVVMKLYRDILGSFWEPERRLVEKGYRDSPFPFRELKNPDFTMTARWNLRHLIGYLGTWSALQTYQKNTGKNPIEAVFSELREAWGVSRADEEREVRWRLSLRAGQI